MTPKDLFFFGGDFLGQILVADSLPGAFVYSRNLAEKIPLGFLQRPRPSRVKFVKSSVFHTPFLT